MSSYVTIPQDMHERIKYLRLKHGYTQDYLAEKLGVSRSSYNTYEAGVRFVSIRGLKILSDLYDVSTDFILCLTNNENPEYINSAGNIVPLNDEATYILHLLSKFDNSKYALDALLTSEFWWRLSTALGILLKIPQSISPSDFSCDGDIAKCIIHLYQEEYNLSLPNKFLGISEDEARAFEFQTLHEIMRTQFDLSMDAFIDSVCNHSQTKEAFAKELMSRYYDKAKNLIEEN